jgi:hypothetical protein
LWMVAQKVAVAGALLLMKETMKLVALMAD